MHIAFLCDDTTKYCDANLELCVNLAKEFHARGHQVSVLGNCENPTDPLEEERDGIRYFRFYYPINRITHQILNEYGRSHSVLRLFTDLLKHPVTALVDVIRAGTGYNPIEKRYAALLKKTNEWCPVDLAIACGGSFYTIHALAKCAVADVRVGYMLDPYWKNCVTGGRRAKKEELFAWRRLDRMVIPKLLEPDYADPAFAPYRRKGIAAEFPGIQCHKEAESGICFEKGKINLLFAGNFYEKIRSPEYLLDLMDAVPDTLCLHVLGGLYGSFNENILTHLQRLQESGRLKLHGSVPAVQARAAMDQADVLVNIGNTVENQLPSKIFEYFSTGKPVIHIQKIQNCPCVPYMERYQNMLILPETDTVDRNAARLAEFCTGERTAIPFAVIKERFDSCTIPFVADLLLSVML